MIYFVSLVSLLLGIGLLMGVRPCCYLLVPEVVLWKKLFGITLTPMYRKTVGTLVIVLSIAMLTFRAWFGLVLRFL